MGGPTTNLPPATGEFTPEFFRPSTFHLPKGGHEKQKWGPKKMGPKNIHGLSLGWNKLQVISRYNPYTYRCPRCKVISFSSCSSTWPTVFFSPQFHRTQVGKFRAVQLRIIRCLLQLHSLVDLPWISISSAVFLVIHRLFISTNQWHDDLFRHDFERSSGWEPHESNLPTFQSADSLCQSFPAGNASQASLDRHRSRRTSKEWGDSLLLDAP